MKTALSRSFRRKIGRAMDDYGMLADGDRVLIAVSGGIDSLVLALVLQRWLDRAPISYTLQGVHIDMDPGRDSPGEAAREVQAKLAGLTIPCHILSAAWRPSPERIADGGGKDVCFHCARSRRNQLFSHARAGGFNKLALGHHRDDIIETFFLNLLQAGNLSTMVPGQGLFSGRLALIRPLAYLEKNEVEAIARDNDLQPVRTSCPLSENTRRRDMQELLDEIDGRFPAARQHIFAALANVRPEYLLSPRSHRKNHADAP